MGQKKGSVLWYTISYSFCHLGYGAAALNRMDKQVWFSVNLRFDLGQLHKNENVKEREKKSHKLEVDGIDCCATLQENETLINFLQ